MGVDPVAKREQEAEMAKMELAVKGMTCGGCERTVSRALERLEGVRGAKADRRAERVVVDHDPARVDEQALRARIVETGYEVV